MSARSTKPVDTLRIDTAVADGRASTLIRVNDVDLLRLQRPRHRPDGSRYPHGGMVFLPPDPVDLLPPDSAALLPTTFPHPAMVGVCTCGFPGCASLWLQVRREGHRVIWEPDPTTLRSRIDTTWRFELRAYLDAVDAGGRSARRWETRARRLAREMRRRRDDLFGFDVGRSRETHARVTAAHAAADSDMVTVQFDGPSGTQWCRVPVSEGRSDEEIIADLVRLGTGAVEAYPI